MKLYLMCDNGGRCVAFENNGKWYILDCSPSGLFGDVDILEGTPEESAERIRNGIDSGILYTEKEQAENLEMWQHIPEWDGKTVSEIENSVFYEI